MPREEVSEKLPAELNRPFSHQHLRISIASCFHNVWLHGTYVYRDWAGNQGPAEQLFCTCWDWLRCSLVVTTPFTSSKISPAPGTFMSLDNPGTLKALPSMLLPLTEKRLEFVLISGLFNIVSFASLGIYIGLYINFSSFLPAHQDLESGPTVIPVTPNIDLSKNACLVKVRLPSCISAISQHRCFPGVWPVCRRI